MAVIRNLIVRAGADFSELQQQMQRAQAKIKNFKENINSSMSSIKSALVAVGTTLFMSDAIQDAAKFEAQMGTLSESLGSSMNDFVKWQNTVGASLGYSKLQSAELANTLSLNFKQFATSQQDLLDKTTKMMETAALISTKRGMAMTEVSDRIRSAMNQEADGADELGVNVRVAAITQSNAYKQMANGTPWDELSTNMQKAILYHHILESVSQNLGSTMQDNTAMRMSAFTASLYDVRLALGQAFLPILNVVLPVLTSFMRGIEMALQYVAAFSSALFGKATSGQKAQAAATNQQAAAMNKLGDSIANTGKKSKKAAADAKGSVASFDEVHQLEDPKKGAAEDDPGAGGGGVGAGGMAGASPVNFETNAPEIGQKVQDFANRVKGIMSDIGAFMSKNKDIITSAIAGIAAGFATFAILSNWTEIVGGLTIAWEALTAALAGIAWPIVAIAALVALFVGNLVYLWRTNEKFRDSVLEVWNKISSFVKGVVSDMWNSVMATWNKYGPDIVNGIGDAMKSIQDLIVNLWENFLKPIMENGLEVLKDLWNNHLKALVDRVLDFVGKLITAALDIYNKFIMPIVNFLVGVLGPIFAAVFSGLMRALGGFLGDVFDFASGLFRILGGIVDFIAGVFTGNWSRAWNGVKDIFGGIFDSLYALVKRPLNWIISMINDVIGGLNSLSIDVPDWVPGVGGQKWGVHIPRIPALAKGGITSGPTLALIGDNPGGEEVVSPLDKLTGIVTNAMMTALSFNQPRSNVSGDIILNVDGKQFARIVKPYLDLENKRVGANVRLQSL
ncbi:hypothetical protein [Ectobacillus ponti]|uniref:Phage tail protein n=1 Tax=Ectobacillus ponti TaxID=2961894 RepID=A0AA41X6Q0_9BACI|nr:hypothetical protein [Ectobacillus ponti]MCP8969727.1 hypothetical protein [Ectobacillus ponti]